MFVGGIMNYEDVEQLLENFAKLPQRSKIEKTIFSIGGRGYYENPTTDLLSFFCDDAGDHGLGSLVLGALIDCLPEKYQSIDRSLNGTTPGREITTSSGRIDLLLRGEQWVMVLENKIFHHQNNPFEDYKNWINANYADATHKVFIILSPYGGEYRESWEIITYKAFITNIKARLSENFVAQPLNKWAILLREFLLHLEGVMYKDSLNNESVSFIFENFSSILELEKLKKAAINEYQQNIQKKLSKELNRNIVTNLHHWRGGYPAMRFKIEGWKTFSDVVLYLHDDAHKVGINFYINIGDDTNTKKADSCVNTDVCDSFWFEQNNKYRGYHYSTEFAFDSFDDIISAVGQRLLEIDKYEQLL